MSTSNYVDCSRIIPGIYCGSTSLFSGRFVSDTAENMQIIIPILKVSVDSQGHICNESKHYIKYDVFENTHGKKEAYLQEWRGSAKTLTDVFKNIFQNIGVNEDEKITADFLQSDKSLVNATLLGCRKIIEDNLESCDGMINEELEKTIIHNCEEHIRQMFFFRQMRYYNKYFSNFSLPRGYIDKLEKLSNERIELQRQYEKKLRKLESEVFNLGKKYRVFDVASENLAFAYADEDGGLCITKDSNTGTALELSDFNNELKEIAKEGVNQIMKGGFKYEINQLFEELKDCLIDEKINALFE